MKLAQQEGLLAVAVTDHDTTAGNAEAMQAGRELDFEVIPGVEISADSPFGSVHIVGLYVDYNDEKLEATLRELREFRDQRNRLMILRLAELGIQITMDELMLEAGGDLVGRPHFAALLVKKGAVTHYKEAFNKYLKAGGAAYLDKKRLPADQAIQMIHDAGGTSVIAHPFVLRKKDQANFEQNIKYLIDRGIQGIEVYYTEHTRGEEALFADLARRYDLVISGGSDFHGTVKPDIRLGRGFGDMKISYDILENIKEARA